MADRHILSVDWDTRELRVVHARLRRDRVQVEDVFAVSIPKEANLAEAADLGRVLRDALQQERVSCRRVIVDIPRDQAVLNTLSLPKVSVSDLAGMVEVQIGKSLPYPAAEAVVDFAVLLREDLLVPKETWSHAEPHPRVSPRRRGRPGSVVSQGSRGRSPGGSPLRPCRAR